MCQMRRKPGGRNTRVASDIQGGLIRTGCEVLDGQWREKEKNVRGTGRTADLQAPGLHYTIPQRPARSHPRVGINKSFPRSEVIYHLLMVTKLKILHSSFQVKMNSRKGLPMIRQLPETITVFSL